MTVEEIFNKVASHMVRGMMYHDEMAQAYDFLGFKWYASNHTEHYIEETENYRNLSHYYTTHYHKLLMLEDLARINLIPESWYKYTSMAVDVGTKRNAIKELMTKWVEWERTTKKLYQEMYKELCSIDEIAAAICLKKYIEDVTNELESAEQRFIELETVGYDIVYIMDQQEK